MSRTSRTTLKGQLFLAAGEQESFSHRQIELLQAIREAGSISAAAKQVGISYKTAWDRIDAMNNLADQPLVVRSAGGAHGGGTRLTEFGEKILSGFHALQSEHAEFVSRLGEQLHDMNDVSRFIQDSGLKTSARNQYRGTVKTVTPGSVNTEVEIVLGGDLSLIAIVTNDSQERLELKPGSAVIALVKASWIILTREGSILTSARNHLRGKISQIRQGEVDAEVCLDLGAGKTLSAIITRTSLDEMGLTEGDEASALFKASSVILMRS
jgi:molybdate transport system regulatory protein